MKYKKEPTFNHNNPSFKTGVLLVNLGTPSALDYFSMRRYLKEFLSDPRVVEKNRFVWWCVLNIILLSFIPFRSRKNYAKIWDKEKNESPLLTTTRAQAEKLSAIFEKENVAVAFGMRYGTPSMEAGLDELKAKGCKKILIFPLYPQYSAVTTASVCDKAFETLKKYRWMPTIKVASPYYKHKAYVKALANSVKAHIKEQGVSLKDHTLICSYHGIPQSYFKQGDPYPCHCSATSAALQKELKLENEQILTAYQSRFGRDEWVKPYFDKTLEELVHQNKKKVVVISPAFASDCVETLEELSIGGKEEFSALGGESYSVVPCLNDSAEGISMLETLIREELENFKL